MQHAEASGASQKPLGTQGQRVPGPPARGARRHHRHQPALQQDAAQKAYGPLLHRIFGRVRAGGRQGFCSLGSGDGAKAGSETRSLLLRQKFGPKFKAHWRGQGLWQEGWSEFWQAPGSCWLLPPQDRELGPQELAGE